MRYSQKVPKFLTLLRSNVKYDQYTFSNFVVFTEYMSFNIIIMCALDDIWQNRPYCLVQYSTEKNEEEGCKVLWVLARCPQFVPLYIDIETDGNGSVYLPSSTTTMRCTSLLHFCLPSPCSNSNWYIYVTRNIFSKIP